MQRISSLAQQFSAHFVLELLKFGELERLIINLIIQKWLIMHVFRFTLM